MARVTKMLVILSCMLLVVTGGVHGGRILKEKVVEPQNFFGGFGGTGTLVPTPFGPAIALGPSGFCSFPGVGCVRVQPTLPGGRSGPSPPSPPLVSGGGSGSSPPSPPLVSGKLRH